MSTSRYSAALVAGVFVAVVAVVALVVVGATVATGWPGHQDQTPAAHHVHSSPFIGSQPGIDPGPGSLASQIPDTSVAAGDEALHTAKGTLVARGDRFRIEKVRLATPIRVPVRNRSVIAHAVYRITITAGPYQMRDMPAVVSLNHRPLAVGMESVDLKSLMAFTFDRSVLTSGATLKVSYGLATAATTIWSAGIEVVK